ncbi:MULTISPECIES: DUF2283 domain-containing protein [unclassified Candidatus Frackibacter]|uniref:DUF2283 domain-containing protein n=1 Tax=unclassified Candidatus Frackibacter TaxID=2648818 RepID=UPI0007951C8F|nr:MULTISPECIES: DUF2283 domain-containing protein [unclassified Candidatus Frackibacter]KXS41051.1 MAG: hypothetical protein AWU54_1761 [Candidatus Frackibacter sp. T328-2]SDC79395.1 Uncharacterized protein YuzE [Candidatus Frackibacter sp. WG11]SFM01825.1 Uncharacterized protein YuzE [Candidatus Frackibacter sp. WG13]
MEIKLRITYDQKADLAYIYLEDIPPGGVNESVRVGDKVLDFDQDGRLLGIEFLDGKDGLPKSLLSKLD